MRQDMVRFVVCGILCLFVVGLCTAEVIYNPPEGGWAYKYDCDMWDPDPAFALDGFWSHDDGSDEWDGTIIGDGNPGGLTDCIKIVGEDTTTFIRMQDTGDPRQYGMSDPGSNRKIYLGYNISVNDFPPGDSTMLDDGVTISFRSRVAVPGGDFELDDWHPADGYGPGDWNQTGDGYLIHDGGKGNFTVHQLAGGTISFSLAVQTDHVYLDSVIQKEGLIMNRTGDEEDWQGAVVDTTFDPASVNMVELDPREWHEFWITIQAADDTTGGATHKVDIYIDGATEPQTFNLTAGGGSDFDGAYMAMGVGATPQEGAYDVDFYAYRMGIHVPTTASSVADQSVSINSFELSQNYPNPFNPTTTIHYSLLNSDQVTLTVYDVLGREVQRVFEEFQTPGVYTVNYNGSDLESGVYFYKLQVGDRFSSMKKMTLIK